MFGVGGLSAFVSSGLRRIFREGGRVAARWPLAGWSTCASFVAPTSGQTRGDHSRNTRRSPFSRPKHPDEVMAAAARFSSRRRYRQHLCWHPSGTRSYAQRDSNPPGRHHATSRQAGFRPARRQLSPPGDHTAHSFVTGLAEVAIRALTPPSPISGLAASPG